MKELPKNNDELYKVGNKVYLNIEGIDYVEVESPDLFEYVDSAFQIVSVSIGENKQDTVYEGFFTIDPDRAIAEICHKELSSFPIAFEILVDEKTETPDIDSYFEQKGRELGALVDRKQQAYGNAVEQGYKVMQVLLEPYKIDDQYLIPQELLLHLLLLTRMIDKVNRIVNNPKFDLMDESPYSDIAGYSLLGSKMTNE